MREDENITTDGNSTVNIEIMTNHDQNEAGTKCEDNEVKTQVKTSPSLEEVEIPATKSRGKRVEGSPRMLKADIFLTV